jgi:nucleoside-diphosphate-sugar epimerase
MTGASFRTLSGQALFDEPITIFGDGQQTRSFCYVTDLIDGLIRLMNSPEGFTGPCQPRQRVRIHRARTG